MKGKVRITIKGHFDKKWNYVFEDMKINHKGENTIITGNIKDEAHLHGILNQIADFNLKLISVIPVEINNK
jgi:hypothetical protein